MMLIRTLIADTEVKLLHAFDFVADILELADGAVSGQTIHDVGEGVGDSIDLLGVFEHGLEVHGGVGDKNYSDIKNIDILLVRLNVAIADSLKADALLDGLFADTNLFTVTLGGHSDHVALGIDVVLAELNILERTVNFLVLALKCADTQEHDPCKRGVLLDSLEVGAVEQNLILVMGCFGK